jgi:hypothetical protein
MLNQILSKSKLALTLGKRHLHWHGFRNKDSNYVTNQNINPTQPNDRVNPEQKHAPKANARLPEPLATIARMIMK